MATWIAHLRVAGEILERFPTLSPVHYVMGNIAPDSGVPSPDGHGFVPPKSLSHNTRTGADGRARFDVEKFASDRLTDDKLAGYDAETRSFYLGYYHHLLTDTAWMNKIYNNDHPSVAGKSPEERAKIVEVIKKDWYDLDFLYLEAHPDFRAWQIYRNAENFENRYIDIFSKDAFSARHGYIVDFYSRVPEDIHRDYGYLTRERMDEFVASTAREIADDDLTRKIAGV